jgi:hypothetical protein
VTTEELLLKITMLREENDKLKKQLENYNNSRKSYYEKNKENKINPLKLNLPEHLHS